MPISSSPFASLGATRNVQQYSLTTGQQRNQTDMSVQKSATNNLKVASSKPEPHLYPEYDPLE